MRFEKSDGRGRAGRFSGRPSSVNPTVEPEPSSGPALGRLDRLAWLMDRAITIPGTRITIGLDAILGLLPVGGDFLTGLVQTGIFLAALYHYRVPRAVAARMAANVLVDVAIGSIPVLGDVFDVFFKANTRNLKLLNQVKHDRTEGKEPSSWRSIAYLVFLVLVVLTLLALVLVGFVTILGWLFRSHPLW
jgi:hypothetical protein